MSADSSCQVPAEMTAGDVIVQRGRRAVGWMVWVWASPSPPLASGVGWPLRRLHGSAAAAPLHLVPAWNGKRCSSGALCLHPPHTPLAFMPAPSVLAPVRSRWTNQHRSKAFLYGLKLHAVIQTLFFLKQDFNTENRTPEWQSRSEGGGNTSEEHPTGRRWVSLQYVGCWIAGRETVTIHAVFVAVYGRREGARKKYGKARPHLSFTQQTISQQVFTPPFLPEAAFCHFTLQSNRDTLT